jgi:16S rRNA (uracil1498-N3)-methyltransferase
MTRRYYSPELPDKGGLIALPDQEASHAAKVMRVTSGDAVVVFSGDGREAEGTIASVDRKMVYVALGPSRRISREPEVAITVGVSLPKGDRARQLVEKLTELGVARLVPLVCQRTQGKTQTAAENRLTRYVIEASKQCERNTLMQIDQPRRFDDWIAAPPEAIAEKDRLRLVAHPGGEIIAPYLESSAIRHVDVIIGPEGGLTDDEVAAATEAGWRTVALGPRILRVETAAVAIVARLVIG